MNLKTIMQKKSFSLGGRTRSIQYAVEGLLLFFRREPNAILHVLATILVLILGICCRVTRTEAIALVLSIGFVWTSEMFNSAIEKVMDRISEENDPRIKYIKDVSAAAVLVAAIAALLVGCLVFVPKIHVI